MGRGTMLLCLFYFSIFSYCFCSDNGISNTDNDTNESMEIISTSTTNNITMEATTMEPTQCTKQPEFNQAKVMCLNDTQTLPAEEGKNLTCSCMENCRNFTIQCQGDGNWTRNENITSFCRKDKKFTYSQGKLNVSFNNLDNFYYFFCAPEHDLVGVNKSFCNSGIGGTLSNPTPTCKPRDVAGNSTTGIDDQTLIYIYISGGVIVIIIIISINGYCCYRHSNKKLTTSSEVRNPAYQMQDCDSDSHDYDYPVMNGPMREYKPSCDSGNEYDDDYAEINVIPEPDLTVNTEYLSADILDDN